RFSTLALRFDLRPQRRLTLAFALLALDFLAALRQLGAELLLSQTEPFADALPSRLVEGRVAASRESVDNRILDRKLELSLKRELVRRWFLDPEKYVHPRDNLQSIERGVAHSRECVEHSVGETPLELLLKRKLLRRRVLPILGRWPRQLDPEKLFHPRDHLA